MKITPSGVTGITLWGPESEDFEKVLTPLRGRVPRELLAPALPYSVIVENCSTRPISLLGIRFDMVGSHAKPYSVIHYADSLRNPEKSDFLPGTSRWVCAEPSFTGLLLHPDGDLSNCGRNLDNLRRMLNFRATLDCVAWDNGRFEGPDSFGAFARLAQQRETEAEFGATVMAADQRDAERLLKDAVGDAVNRTRRALAMKLMESLQAGGYEEMLARARNHRLKIAVWR